MAALGAHALRDLIAVAAVALLLAAPAGAIAADPSASDAASTASNIR